MDLSKNIESYDLIFLDLETTGLDVVMGDAICEIGAYKVKERKITDKFHSLINPQRLIPQEAYRVHKISDKDVKFAPPFEKVVQKLTSFAQGGVVCAYNVGFDMGFVEHQLKNLNQPPLGIPAVDILAMARDGLSLTRYNLETVAKSFDIDCSGGLHRALDDALISYRVFFKLLDIFKEKKIETLNEFVCLYGFNNDIVKAKEAEKATLIKQAIEKEQPVRLTYFSGQSKVEEETITPLRILQENRYFYLLYQGPQETSSRIRSNRIFAVKAI